MQMADTLKYTREHEWVKITDEGVTVGITKYAAEQLGDIIFVELPSVGVKFAAGDKMAVLESVKAVSDVYAPISGEVVKVNDMLNTKPDLLNEDPISLGWIATVKASDLSELDGLMDEAGYVEFLKDGGA